MRVIFNICISLVLVATLAGMSLGLYEFYLYAKKYRPAYKEKEKIIIWSSEIPDSVSPSMTLIADDMWSYVVGDIESVPKNKGENYSVRIKESYGQNNKNKVDEVLEFNESDIKLYANYKAYIDKLRSIVKTHRFKISFEDIETRLDTIKRLQYSMEGNDYDVSTHIDKYIEGSYIVSDVFRINRAKKTSREILLNLNEIFKLDLNYHTDYGHNVIELSRLLEIESYIRRNKFSITPEGDVRIIQYSMHMLNSSEIDASKVGVYLKDAYENGADLTKIFNNGTLDNSKIEDFKDIIEKFRKRRIVLAKSIRDELDLQDQIKIKSEILAKEKEKLVKFKDKNIEISDFSNYLIKYVEEFKAVTTVEELTRYDRKSFDVRKDDLIVNEMEKKKVTPEQIAGWEDRQKKDLIAMGKLVKEQELNVENHQSAYITLLKNLRDVYFNRINVIKYDVDGSTTLKLISTKYDLGEIELKEAMTNIRYICVDYSNPDIFSIYETKLFLDINKQNSYEVESYLSLSTIIEEDAKDEI